MIDVSILDYAFGKDVWWYILIELSFAFRGSRCNWSVAENSLSMKRVFVFFDQFLWNCSQNLKSFRKLHRIINLLGKTYLKVLLIGRIFALSSKFQPRNIQIFEKLLLLNFFQTPIIFQWLQLPAVPSSEMIV